MYVYLTFWKVRLLFNDYLVSENLGKEDHIDKCGKSTNDVFFLQCRHKLSLSWQVTSSLSDLSVRLTGMLYLEWNKWYLHHFSNYLCFC